MNKIEEQPPVIIIGMHRSGTNLITRILMDLGVFMGWLRDGNNEAFFYLRKNETIFEMAGATWDNPASLDALLQNEAMVGNILASMQQYCRSYRNLTFWGPLRVLSAMKSSRGINTAWGWKDPRNTFILPLWINLYRDAKVINVVRNGIDVAASLRRREEKRLRKRKNMRHFSRRCLELEGGFALWEEYVQKGLLHEGALRGRCLRIRYEDFLENPLTHIASLVKFLGLSVGPEKMREAAAAINRSRGNAFLHDPELRSFFEKVKDTESMRALGYNDEL